MRIQLGDIPHTEGPPDTAHLHAIHAPGARMSYALATAAGLLLPCAPFTGLVVWSFASASIGAGAPARPEEPVPWIAILATVVLYVPLHELLHLLWHPDGGRSAHSVVVLWPAKLRFGVYYDGCMSRARWLWMRAAPFVFLTLLPAVLLVLLHAVPIPWALEVSLQVLFLVNGLGSGGDAVAMALVLRQVPRTASLCFRGGRAYWSAAL